MADEPTLLAGRYEHVRELGQGGAGRVVLARDTSADRQVALKIVPPEHAERLRWELELGSRLRHPHLAEMFELLSVTEPVGAPFHVAAGSSVLVEEAIAGAEVEELLASSVEPVSTVLRMTAEVASALAALHAMGWVHGDIKPANVRVREDGSAVLIDFGLSGPPLDADGRVRGTPGYLAPEAWTGVRSVATDVFALGATLAQWLGGDVDSRLRDPDAAWSRSVHGLVASMLHADPADRLADARAVVGAIEDVRRQLGEAVEPNVVVAATPAELALRVQSLPWVGDAQEIRALSKRIEEGGVVRVGGADGSGRSRWIREAVRDVQHRAAQLGRVVPTYVTHDGPTEPPQGACVLHLRGAPAEGWVEAQMRAAAVSGHLLSIVIEGTGGEFEQCEFERRPLRHDELRALVCSIVQRDPSDAELERAMDASGGLSGRACVLASQAWLAGDEPFARVQPEDVTVQLSETIAWVAWHGGSVGRADARGRHVDLAALERDGLGWRYGAHFRLRRDVHRAALDDAALREAIAATDASSDEPVAQAYLAACASNSNAERLFEGVIRATLDRGEAQHAESIARDAVAIFGSRWQRWVAEALRTQGHYDDALSLLDDEPAEQAEVLRRLGRADEAKALLSELPASTALVTRALLGENVEDAPRWTRAERRAWSAIASGSFDAALEHVRRGLQSLAGQHGRDARRARARLRSTEGSVAHAAGRPAEAAVAYEAARRIAESLGERHLEATCEANLGAASLDLGDLGDGLRVVEQGARRFLRLGRDRDAARALVNLASAALWIGDDARAARAATQASEAATRASDEHAQGYTWLVDVELALRRGRLEQARQLALEPPDDSRVRCRAAALWAVHDKALAASLLDAGDGFAYSIARARLDLAEGKPLGSLTLVPATWEQRLQLGLLLLDASEHDAVQSASARASLRRVLDRAAETLTPAQRRMMRRVPVYQRVWTSAPSSDASTSDRRWRRLVAQAKRLSATRDVQRIRELVVQTAVELVDAERGFWVERAPTGELRILARDAFDDSAEVSRSVVSRALDAQRTVRATDALEDERLVGAQSVHAMALRSVLCVPLRQGSAALYLDDRLRPAAFDDDSARLLEDLSDLAGIALVGAERLHSEKRAVRRLEEARRELQARVDSQAHELEGLRRSAGVVALSASMQRTMQQVSRVATTDAPVLLTGESGTGKERIASAVHALSHRREGPFVAVACAAIPEALLESTIFGHERGAFTGAHESRRGVFEQAKGGTLFLDEIGEMPASMQAKLLRVVQEGEFRRVGSEVVQSTDVRIVTATHRDLKSRIAEQSFREDLYYRLAVVRIDVPPLRERMDDLPRLVESMLAELESTKKLTGAAMGALVAHPWPGNVRELRNVLERALVSAGETIDVEDLGLGTRQTGWDLKAELEALETRLIRGAMLESEGNQTKAAQLLGVSRYGLQKKLKRLGLK